MTAVVTPIAYWTTVLLVLGCALAICLLARREPGRWREMFAASIGLLLLADALTYSIGLVVAGTWSPATSLPLALCNVGVLVAAIACLSRNPLSVELTYFWGLAGTIQAVITPDLASGFPHLVFFEYLAGHLGIVVAALFLVLGLGIRPRPGAVVRVATITALYTAAIGLVDALAGANYMFLRRPPGEWTVLRVLGPWPWYVVSAACVGVALLVVLDLPFWWSRRRVARS